MSAWRPQHYRRAALATGAVPATVAHAVSTGALTVKEHEGRPPVLSLRHVAHLADVPYRFLREVVGRREDPYRLYRIRKRVTSGSKRYRVICVPEPPLLRTQSWIAQSILRTATPHRASTAFAKGDDIVSAATHHCNAQWLVKLDVENFFESITEISAYRVFLDLGYQPLVAFELARLCTRVRSRPGIWRNARWRSRPRGYKIRAYSISELGYLPQVRRRAQC